MKIVLSPSKTKTIIDAAKNDGAVNHAVRDGQFQPHITQEIVKHVQSLDAVSYTHLDVYKRQHMLYTIYYI